MFINMPGACFEINKSEIEAVNIRKGAKAYIYT